MTSDHVVRPRPGEERAGWWWPIVGFGACVASAALTLTPVVLWFLSRSLEQQRAIVETGVGGVVVAIGLVLLVDGSLRSGR